MLSYDVPITQQAVDTSNAHPRAALRPESSANSPLPRINQLCRLKPIVPEYWGSGSGSNGTNPGGWIVEDQQPFLPTGHKLPVQYVSPSLQSRPHASLHNLSNLVWCLSRTPDHFKPSSQAVMINTGKALLAHRRSGVLPRQQLD